MVFFTTPVIGLALSIGFISSAPLPQDGGALRDVSAVHDAEPSIKPGDDFYRFANAGWLQATTVPEGKSSYDTRTVLNEKAARSVRDLIQAAAAAPGAKGGASQKVGDFYTAFMDASGIEAKRLTPIAGEMNKVSAISTRAHLSAYLGSTLNSEVDGLTANADHVLGVWINQGFSDGQHNYPHLWQGGLGMPDRENYLDPSPKMAELRAQYQKHIAAILKLAGVRDPEASAVQVLSLEVRIAQTHAPDADASDAFKQNNPWKRSDFAAKAPGMDWRAYFNAAGLGGQSDFIVWQPSTVTGLSALVDSLSLEVWKDYLKFHLLEHYASVLPSAIAVEDFNFYGKVLAGAQSTQDRTKLALDATSAALPQAVGLLYTQQYFPAEAKAKAQAMASDLITACRARISALKWMSPQTKTKALEKLAAFKLGVGYPDHWIDYSSFDVVRDDAFGNMRRAEAFNRAHNLALLKSPVDPIDWPLNVHVPGAVIMFSPNAEFFAAAILQPPYFDYQGDVASNYGSAGAGMAHEITHSFDELGNIYDSQGRLVKWWTGEDLAAYHQAAAGMSSQLDGYCPFADLCVKGKQVSGESIADLAGLLIAHEAYLLSLKGKDDVLIGGLTGEQRFFLAFAHRWRKIQNDDALRRQIANDTHAPAPYRSDAVRNVDAWYKAFQVTPDDKLYLKPQDRVQIW